MVRCRRSQQLGRAGERSSAIDDRRPSRTIGGKGHAGSVLFANLTGGEEFLPANRSHANSFAWYNDKHRHSGIAHMTLGIRAQYAR